MLKEMTWGKANKSWSQHDERKKEAIPLSITVLNGAGRLVWRERLVQGKRSRVLWWLRAQGRWADAVVTHPSLTGCFQMAINLPCYLLRRKRKWGGKERESCNQSVGWQAGKSKTVKKQPLINLPLHNRAVAHTHQAFSSTETCCLRGWHSCSVLENSWRRRGKHFWAGTWSS